MSNEAIGGIISKIDGTCDHYIGKILDVIVQAWDDGDIYPHDVVERGDHRDLIFNVNGDLYKIGVSLDSYGEAYRNSGIVGPLKAVEKTLTVYE